MPEAIRRNVFAALAACAAAAILAPWFSAGAYGMRLAAVAGIYALLAIGYQRVFGQLGTLSLAQGAFFGIGAYATALLSVKLGLDGALTLAASVAIAVGLAGIVGAAVLRLESHYFALATLGLAQLAQLVAVNAEELTGGANGIAGVPGLALFGTAIPRGWPLTLACWTAVAVAAAIAWPAAAGRKAHALLLARDDPVAAEALGIDTGRLRFTAFLFAAGCAGAAGAFNAHLLGIVSPEVLDFPVMVACLSMVVIGGRTRIAGAVIGAVLLVHLPELLRGIGPWYLAAYGVCLLAVTVFAPEGIAGALGRLLAPAPRETPAGPPVPAAAGAPAPGPGGAALSLRGVSKRFGGVTALDGIDLDIAAGAMVGIIGPNGSGKTTLVNAIAGLYRPDAGRIVLAGRDIAGAPAWRVARAGVGRGFQAPRLVESLTVQDNVAVAAVAAADAASAQRTTRHALELTRLHALSERRLGALPAGIRRRVEIARALAGRPRLLLLDEPAAGLTPAEQEELRAILAELNRGGLTILIVDHSVAFLRRLVPRLVCIVEGRIAADGTPGDVIRHPQVVAAYLGRRP